MARLRAIAAVSENGVIGDSGGIPWRIPSDFRWFREMTMGGVLVQGRKTFESIGRALPGRETWVLTRTARPWPDVRTFSSLDSLRAAVLAESRVVWLCGGAELYAQLLPECTDLFLSRIHRPVEGDALFPPFEKAFLQIAEVLREPEFHVEHWVHRSTLLA